MRKVKIKNLTQWATRDLRRFVIQALNEVDDLNKKKVVHCTFKVSRFKTTDGCAGNAYLNGSHMVIKLRNDFVDKIDLAFVLGHEIGHLLGLDHADMRGSARWNRLPGHRGLYAWGSFLPLNKQPVLASPPKPSNSDKAAHCQKMIDAWERKQNRASTAIKKWEKKLKYYQKKEA